MRAFMLVGYRNLVLDYVTHESQPVPSQSSCEHYLAGGDCAELVSELAYAMVDVVFGACPHKLWNIIYA